MGDASEARPQAYVALQAELQEARRELEELQERAARREQIQPAGLQELQDQLEMADEVRATLCADIAKRTEELVQVRATPPTLPAGGACAPTCAVRPQVKLERAQESVLLEETVHKLRHQTAKNRQLALRMTELEVQLAERENTSAETEEGIAGAFREVMQMQEKKIIDLEERLRESKEALDAAAEKGGGGSKPKRKGSLW